MNSYQDLNLPTRIQDGCPSSTLSSKESFGIMKITEGFIVYRSTLLGRLLSVKGCLLPTAKRWLQEGVVYVLKETWSQHLLPSDNSFQQINPIMDLSSSAFQRGWGPSEQLKGRKLEMLDRWKIFGMFLLKSRRSYQGITFPTRTQDRTPRDNQRDAKGIGLTGRKTLASFYWCSQGFLRTSLFPQGPRMGSQGTSKGTKKENAWQVEEP